MKVSYEDKERILIIFQDMWLLFMKSYSDKILELLVWAKSNNKFVYLQNEIKEGR